MTGTHTVCCVLSLQSLSSLVTMVRSLTAAAALFALLSVSSVFAVRTYTVQSWLTNSNCDGTPDFGIAAGPETCHAPQTGKFDDLSPFQVRTHTHTRGRSLGIVDHIAHL